MLWLFGGDFSVSLRSLYFVFPHGVYLFGESDLLFRHDFVLKAFRFVSFSSGGGAVSDGLLDGDLSLGGGHASSVFA